MNRKLLIRSAVVLVLIMVAVFLFIIGKGYTLLLDNKDFEYGGKTYEAFEMVKVWVDREEPIELYPRDRDMVMVSGKAHTIGITVYNKNYDEIGTRELKFRLKGKGSMFLLSMPAFGAELEPWFAPFKTPEL